MYSMKNPTPIMGKMQPDPLSAVIADVTLLVTAFERGELGVDEETHARLTYLAKDLAAYRKEQKALLASIH